MFDRITLGVGAIAALAVGAGFAWFSRDFGPSNAAILSLFFVPPLLVAVRLRRRWPNVLRRELGFLAIVLCASLAAIGIVAQSWYASGMDRMHAEDVRWARFETLLRKDPKFRHVAINLLSRRQTYWASGTVASQADLDRLKSLATRCGLGWPLDGPFEGRVTLTIGPPRPDPRLDSSEQPPLTDADLEDRIEGRSPEREP